MIETYTTSDFYLACYLKARGYRLIGTERQGRRITFAFEERSDREALVLSFYGDGVVQVNAFTHAIQDLKSVVYNC